MIHRGELYTLEPNSKSILVVYGTAKDVAEALYMAYMYNKEAKEYPKLGISNVNIFKYEFAKFKELFERDEGEGEVLWEDEEREARRKNWRKRFSCKRLRQIYFRIRYLHFYN